MCCSRWRPGGPRFSGLPATRPSLAGADCRALLSLHGVGPRGLAIVDAALAAAGHERAT